MKKYLYLILFFLVCVPAIAGTIDSYTLKSPPDDADTIVIYDSDDGSTKKIQVGDISSDSSGFTDGGTNVYATTTSDNVAIGTTTPTTKLTVSGTVSATAFTGDGSGLTGITSSGWTDGGTNVYLTDTTDTIAIGTTTPNSTTLEIVKQSTISPLKISSSASGGGDYLLITSSGNIGINSTSPGAKLVVNGNLQVHDTDALYFGNDNQVFFVASAATTPDLNAWTPAGMMLSIKNAGGIVINENSNNGLVPLRVEGDTDANLLYLDGTNNRFGIGTFSPTAKLSIYSNGTTTGSALRVLDSSGNLKFNILDGGNIGIGTATPGAKLDIFSGSIRAIGIGTTVPQQLCRKEDGTFGYFDGVWAGTCN